jgi:hypothetical protein
MITLTARLESGVLIWSLKGNVSAFPAEASKTEPSKMGMNFFIRINP